MSRGKQGNLFGPSLNPVFRLKAAMRQAMSESRFSRAQIADRMNEAAAREGLNLGRGHRITTAVIDAWVAESKTNLIPLSLLPLFCWAAESLLPLQVLAGCLGATVIDPQDARLLALAQTDLEVKQLTRRKRQIMQEIEETNHE